MRDADIPAWWQRLDLPGLIDIHTHFMPAPVMDAVWRFFDDARSHYGVEWPVQYKGTDADRTHLLREFGVRHFTALVYPHKPGMAASLNEWAMGFAAVTPECVPSATFYPEATAPEYVRSALERGARVFKVHLQVGDYDPREPVLDPVWGMLAEAAVAVVVHCGSGPVPGRHTGPGPIGEVLAAHPRLTAVIAHAGAPEYDEHTELAERYRNVHLDTTMVGTDFMNRLARVPPGLVRRWALLEDRIVLGTDFPNIPYEYAHQLEALERLELGERWLQAVCWTNGARLLGVE